jgi:hypothetical protein
MERKERAHILFLGLDHRLLWQLTRTLAHFEDRLVIDCVTDPSEAKEICDREPVDVIVVDGWEKASTAARYLCGDEAFEGGAWKWIILAESLPLECLPSGRLSPSALFLEKPFNPKEFPSFVLRFIESGDFPRAAESPRTDLEAVSLPVVRGEAYRAPGEAEPGARTGTAPGPAEPDAFHRHVDEGFACLSGKDWKGAEEHWSIALRLRPNDPRLQANLRRLQERMAKKG